MTKEELNKKLIEQERRNRKLLFDNLKMRIQLETIAENPEGKAAGKILGFYQRLIGIRKENSQASQN